MLPVAPTLRLTGEGRFLARILVKPVVYARHGRELMGCKSPMCESGYDHLILTQTLADDKGGVVRFRLKEARVQSCEPTNRNVI
jgi:hypothetical protein